MAKSAMASKAQEPTEEAQLTAKEKRALREKQLIADAEAKGRADAMAELNKNSTLHPDLIPNAHGDIAHPQYAGDKVIVACKLGVSAIDIQLSEIVEKFEQNQQGGRMVKEAIRIGDVVRIRGTAYPRGTPPKGFPPAPLIVDGAALTMGVDRTFMETWLDQNKRNPIVMNRMIFIHKSIDGIRGLAHDYVAERSGLDPLDPSVKDPRITKSSRPEVSDVEPGKVE